MWHDPMPGTEPGFPKQQNTLRDALVVAIHLNVFNQHADRVRMANLAQTVNVLQALLLYDHGQLVKTPTYHIFDMFEAHQDATLLPMDLERGTYTHGGEETPALTASASRYDQGQIHVTLANTDPDQPRTVEADVRGQAISSVSGRILTADRMDAHNSFEQPETIRPGSFDKMQRAEDILTLELPPKSVVALTLK